MKVRDAGTDVTHTFINGLLIPKCLKFLIRYALKWMTHLKDFMITRMQSYQLECELENAVESSITGAFPNLNFCKVSLPTSMTMEHPYNGVLTLQNDAM